MVCPHLHSSHHSSLFCRYCIDRHIESMSKRASASTPDSDDRTRRANFGPPAFSDICKDLGEDFEVLSTTKPSKLGEPIEGVKKSPVADSPVPGTSFDTLCLLQCCLPEITQSCSEKQFSFE